MSTTLADMMLLVAKEVTLVEDGVADGGSTTTLFDAQRQESGGYWSKGIIFFTSGDNDGVTRKIDVWDDDAHQFTFTTLGTAVSAGDTYEVATKDFTPEQIIQAINMALAETRIPTFSTITNTGTYRYAIPSGVSNIKRLEVDAGSDGEDFVPHTQWYLNGGYIYFDPDTEPVQNYEGDIRVTYMASHAKLTADTSAINSLISDDYLKWLACVKLMEKEDLRYRGENPKVAQKLQECRAYYQIHSQDQPDMEVERTIRSSKWGHV